MAPPPQPVSTTHSSGRSQDLSQNRKRVIVNADDFGRSSSINRAVIEAFRSGILTSASLMVGGAAFEEAVSLARAHPGLGVGLHLTLADGRAVGSRAEVGAIVGPDGLLEPDPVAAGLKYFFRPSLRPALRAEIAAQFALFRSTGLPLDHLNGHLNIHLHPVIFDLLWEQRASWEGSGFRLTRDPFRINARLASGRWLYRGSHALIFSLLSWRAARRLRSIPVRSVGSVFGLLQYPSMDERYWLGLLSQLPAGDSEIYSHPSLDDFKHEFDALVSPGVAGRMSELGIQRIRYADLSPSVPSHV